jgi:hypothetical protein
VTQSPGGSINPIPSSTTSTVTQSPGGSIMPHYQHGGSFIVPPGFNKDDFLARFSSGELVMAFTKAQQRQMAAPQQAMNTSNYERNVNYHYSPTYGAAPNNPQFDFAIMQARSGY